MLQSCVGLKVGREVMDRYRYFMFNQRSMVMLGILQVACAGLCVVCGFIDATFRKSTALSSTRAPMWAGMVRHRSHHLDEIAIWVWLDQRPPVI